MTNQPIFRAIANLGDTDPLTYGGAFVVIDQRELEEGEEPYTPELHIFEEPTGEPSEWKERKVMGEWEDYETESTLQYERHVVLLDRCTYINNTLSDNKYHPDHPAWWAAHPNDLIGICSCMDISQTELIAQFCSEDPIERARAYLTLVLYWGPQDGYPDTFTEEEAAPLFERFFKEIKEFEDENQD